MFHESLIEEEDPCMFQGCVMIFKGVSRVFQGSFKKTLRFFKKKVSCCMALIAASRAEGGLVLVF